MAATPLQSARSLLARAVELDTAQRYSEALICYEEAIQMLIKCIPGNNAVSGDSAVSERPCAVTSSHSSCSYTDSSYSSTVEPIYSGHHRDPAGCPV